MSNDSNTAKKFGRENVKSLTFWAREVRECSFSRFKSLEYLDIWARKNWARKTIFALPGYWND